MLANQSILKKINATDDLAENDMRVLRASMSGLKATNANFLSETVKAVADEMHLERMDALRMLKAYVEIELATENAVISSHWQENLAENMGVHAH